MKETIPKTQKRVLLTAEKLFAKYGFAGTSIRQLTREAHVSLSAIHYHYGSKRGLFIALMRYRIGHLDQERLKMLDAAKDKAGTRPIKLETLVRAIMSPVAKRLKEGSKSKDFMILLGRVFNESPELKKEIFHNYFLKTSERFISAFHHTLPHYSKRDIYWQFHLMISTLTGALAQPDRLTMISKGTCKPDDPDDMIERMIRFVVGGFRII